LKKDRTWLKYELHCNVKTPAPLFFQNNLTFVIQMLINVFPRIVFVLFFFTIPWLVWFFFTLLPVIKLIKGHWHGSRHISVIINETYKFNLQSYFDTSLYQLIFLVRFTEDADIKRDQSEDELLNAHHTIKEQHVIAVLHFSHSMIFNNGHWSICFSILLISRKHM
jgi:hypothetical protein